MSTLWGEARREVDTFYGEISAKLDKGQTVKSIFGDLKAAGHLSVAYDNFRRHINRRYQSRGKQSGPSSWGIARSEVIALRSQIRAAPDGARRCFRLPSTHTSIAGPVSASISGFPAAAPVLHRAARAW